MNLILAPAGPHWKILQTQRTTMMTEGIFFFYVKASLTVGVP